MFIEGKEKVGQPQAPQKAAGLGDRDRRYLPRWEVDNKIRYQKENDAPYQECRSKDINCSGACMRTSEDIPLNQALNLTIYLADGIEPIYVHGHTRWRVVRDNESLVGIQFDRINDKTSDRIFQYAFEYKREELMKRWFKST